MILFLRCGILQSLSLLRHVGCRCIHITRYRAPALSFTNLSLSLAGSTLQPPQLHLCRLRSPASESSSSSFSCPEKKEKYSPSMVNLVRKNSICFARNNMKLNFSLRVPRIEPFLVDGKDMQTPTLLPPRSPIAISSPIDTTRRSSPESRPS